MRQIYIDGKLTSSSATDGIAVIDPATEALLDWVPAGGAEDVEAAVLAATEAFYSWRRTEAKERARLLREAASQIRAHGDALVRLLTLEQGKPGRENAEELEWAAAAFDTYADLASQDGGPALPAPERRPLHRVLKEPYGVAACIVPWTYPLLLLAGQAAPALAAGSTVIVKPSEYAPLTALYLAEHCLGHLPAGVLNLVTGYGREAGEALVIHRDAPVIAFTGSLATGQHIARLAAPMMKNLRLELGGKGACVVADEADPEPAARAVARFALLNAGQGCTSTQRVYLPRSRAAQFTEALVEHVRGLRVGPGVDPATEIGPLRADNFRARVEEHVAEAQTRGARVLTGGRRSPHLPRGYFYEPTVLAGVDHSMRIMREETLGPAIPLMEYSTFDEAIALANDSPYGLSAWLLTHDPLKAQQFYEDVRASTIWISDPIAGLSAGPFGRRPLSGAGRQVGRAGLEAFRQTKQVHWDRGPGT